jgi:BirA family biotin operon repressor/biotin-[acetyl-CoA-carboxylase] ligase
MMQSCRADRLDAKRLGSDLVNVLIGREIIALAETTSTNDAVWQRARRGAPEGLVVFAEHQSAGRGQRGQTWESTAGKGLWFSFLLRPGITLWNSARLTAWAARVVAEIVASCTTEQTTIKFPNDVYVNGRKIAGVLVEMRAQKDMPHLAIVGIGMNVNQSLSDFSETLRERATSLALLQNRLFDRNEVAVALLRKLDQSYRSRAF